MFVGDGWVEFDSTSYVEIVIYPIVVMLISHVFILVLVRSQTSQDRLD